MAKRKRSKMKNHLIAFLFIAVGTASQVQAQQNLDMINNEMISNGLFIPHTNYCDSSTEAFVPVGFGGTGGNRGFCIEKSQRSGGGSDSWEDARQDCADEGKRLPEIAEWKIACQLAGSLSISNMTDDWEWAGNFPYNNTFKDSSWFTNGEASIVGSGSCLAISAGAFSSGSSSENTALSYRCVR
jgi:hypothetical protein